MTEFSIHPRLMQLLVCPRDGAELEGQSDALVCVHGHRYPVVDGVPVFLLREQQPTLGVATASLDAAETASGAPLFVETLGISAEKRQSVAREWRPDATIDAAVAYLVADTCGYGYAGLVGAMREYPIPDIPIEAGDGRLLLDIGCSWGRWSFSASRKGWRVVGMDPSLGAIMAAKRVFAGSGLEVQFVCGDARFLPFRSGCFDVTFSYSVIQHFSEADASAAIAEMGRVLAAGGCAKIQMAARGGLRGAYIRRRADYMKSGPFRVRYWPLAALRQIFERNIGPAKVIAEAFGGLGLLAEDWRYVSPRAKILIALSLLMKRVSAVAPPITSVADSVYVVAAKSA